MSDRGLLADAPPPRGTPYRLGLVCLGNICRSPTADVVVRALVDRAGLTDVVEVTSSGTGDWHVGGPMDPRAADHLTRAGYDATRHRAQQVGPHWLEHDLLLAMDAANLDDLLALGADPARTGLFRSFDPEAGPGDLEVPDPYGGGDDGFATVLAMVERTGAVLVERISARLR